MKGGMQDRDLEQLGEVLQQGEAGLIVVYATNLQDQIAANIRATNKRISSQVDANTEELARRLEKLNADS
jgi:hypothetical protein